MNKADAKKLTIFTSSHTVHHLYTIIIPSIIPIIKVAFNLSYVEISLLPAFFSLGHLFQLLFGVYTDKYRKPHVIVAIGLIFISITIASLGVATDFYLLIFLTFMVGVASSTYHPAGTTLIVNNFPKRSGFALGIHSIGGSLGYSIGPVLLGILIGFLGWRNSLFFYALPGLVVGSLYWFFLRDFKSSIIDDSKDNSNSTQPVFHFRSISLPLILLLLGNFMSQFAMETMQDFVPIYLTDIYLVSISAAIFLLGLMRFFGVIGGPIGGLGIDRFGAKKIMMLGFIGQSILIFFFTQVNVDYGMYLILALLGLFVSIQLPASNIYLAHLFPVKHRGKAFALYFTISISWISVVPILSGIIVQQFGFELVFIVSSILSLTGAGVISLLKDLR